MADVTEITLLEPDTLNASVFPVEIAVEEITSVVTIVIGGGGGGTIPATTNMLKGDGAGNAADAGFAASAVALKQTGYATPNTINEIIACLQAAGLCA